MAISQTGRPGRPAAASREEAIELATRCFLAGERVDVQAIAESLGLARATMHRWFGTRDRLVGEMLAALGERRLRSIRARTRGRGARALLSCFDEYNRELAGSEPLRV
jgi:AcrR family transcriptional regulator